MSETTAGSGAHVVTCRERVLGPFTCVNCQTSFKNKKSVFSHIKSKICEKEKKLKIVYPRMCVKCSDFYPCKVAYSNHVRICGRRKLKPRKKFVGPQVIEKFNFPDKDAFLEWKENTELDTFSFFSNRTGKRRCKGTTYIYYTCQFNTSTKTQEESEPLEHKSEKRYRSRVCPATMKVFVQEGGVDVTFYSRHNHPLSVDNVKYQPVKASLRAELERQLLRGVPRIRVLENVKQWGRERSAREELRTERVTMRYLSRLKYGLSRQGRLHPDNYDYDSDENLENLDNLENDGEHYLDQCSETEEQDAHEELNFVSRKLEDGKTSIYNANNTVVVVIDCKRILETDDNSSELLTETCEPENLDLEVVNNTDLLPESNKTENPDLVVVSSSAFLPVEHVDSEKVVVVTSKILTGNSILFTDAHRNQSDTEMVTPVTPSVLSKAPETALEGGDASVAVKTDPDLLQVSLSCRVAEADFCVQCGTRRTLHCRSFDHKIVTKLVRLMCEKCNRKFSSLKCLYQHEKLSSCTLTKKTKISYPRKCEKCNKIWASKNKFNNHRRSCGMISKLKKTKCIVGGCDMMFFRRVDMISHIETVHSLKIEKHEFHLANLTEFEKWKEEMELKTFSYFSSKSGRAANSSGQYLYFSCQFDQQDKTHGSVRKTDVRAKRGCIPHLNCPARICVRVLGDDVKVTYFATHNHKLELENVKYQRIKPSMQARLEEQLGKGLKPREIVARLRAQLGERRDKNSCVDVRAVYRNNYRRRLKERQEADS